jgi:hypothetical protein
LLTFLSDWLRGLEPLLELGRIQLVSDSLQACEEIMLQAHAQYLVCHGRAAVANRLEPAGFRFRVFCAQSDLFLLYHPDTSKNSPGQR